MIINYNIEFGRTRQYPIKPETVTPKGNSNSNTDELTGHASPHLYNFYISKSGNNTPNKPNNNNDNNKSKINFEWSNITLSNKSKKNTNKDMSMRCENRIEQEKIILLSSIDDFVNTSDILNAIFKGAYFIWKNWYRCYLKNQNQHHKQFINVTEKLLNTIDTRSLLTKNKLIQVYIRLY